MALLGKTLKGRSTRPGAQSGQDNIKKRFMSKEQWKLFEKQAQVRKKELKEKIAQEQKLVSFNKKKLVTYWRKILRLSKTEQLKNQIDIIAQNNSRELDSKEAFLQMLDKNLDESEDQFQIALRNHLIHLDHLISLQESRLLGLSEEFKRDSQIIEAEFDREKEEMLKNFKKKEKELKDLIQTVKDEDKKKENDLITDHQAFREETKNKASEDTTHMKLNLDAKQSKYYNDLEQLHQKYQSETSKKTDSHTDLFTKNKNLSAEIDNHLRNIQQKRGKIEITRLKILQHRKECQQRNSHLKKEKENIQKSYQDLKLKMTKFRENESKRLTELVTNSRNAVKQLQDYQELGEKILKTAELCRRLETEKEKVLPFYENTIDENTEIPEDLKTAFHEIKGEQYQEYSYLNFFYKRFNKVLLDKLAIQKQKESLEKDNILLKSLLKQYLDGISLNDDVLRNNNPLFIVNNKIDISRPPVEKMVQKPIIEGVFVVNNNNLQQGNFLQQ